MKKPLFVILVLSLVLSACLPAFLQQQPVAGNNEQAPQVDIEATAAVMAATMAVETIDALPTPTLIPPSKVVAVSATPTIFTIIDPNILITTTMQTLNVTGMATTATGTITPTVTATHTPTPNNGIVTPTQTLHARFYGTLPPNLPSGSILLSNKSQAEAYISLQCTTSDGNVSILEYPVKGNLGIDAPAGHYTFVAWVGGNKMIGNFRLDNGQDLFITLYKDKVGIK